MLLPRIGALLLAATTVHARKDASPFFLLSSDPLPKDAPLRSTQIALTQDVEDQLVDSLSACDKKHYYIFTQSSVTANDFHDGGMAKMQKRIADAKKDTVVEIPELVGGKDQLRARKIEERLRKECDARGKIHVDSWPEKKNEYSIIPNIELPELPSESEARVKSMRDTDDALDDVVASVLKRQQSAVIIYITTPPSPAAAKQQDTHIYEMDDPYPSSLHTELKRDLDLHARQSNASEHMQDGLPLFEKYQFLSPGIFMGLTTALLLGVILYVGITAIAGLEVSYAAFSKEMGPQAQRSKQQ